MPLKCGIVVAIDSLLTEDPGHRVLIGREKYWPSSSPFRGASPSEPLSDGEIWDGGNRASVVVLTVLLPLQSWRSRCGARGVSGTLGW